MARRRAQRNGSNSWTRAERAAATESVQSLSFARLREVVADVHASTVAVPKVRQPADAVLTTLRDHSPVYKTRPREQGCEADVADAALLVPVDISLHVIYNTFVKITKQNKITMKKNHEMKNLDIIYNFYNHNVNAPGMQNPPLEFFNSLIY